MASLNLAASCKSGALAESDSQVSWFDASMVYIRVTNCQQTRVVGDDVPDSLVMHFPPRDVGVCVEVNGARIPPSEEAYLVLRCSRPLKENHLNPGELSRLPDAVTEADFMYVSTDNLRTSSTLQFEILERRADSATQAIASGSLEKKLPDHNKLSINCEVIGPDGCAFVEAKHQLLHNFKTMMEICVVGRFMGEPMILTQTLPLKPKHSFTSPNAIPEDKQTLTMASSSSSLDFFDEVLSEVEPFFDMPRINSSSISDSAALAKVTSANLLIKAQLSKFESDGLYLTVTDQEEKWYKRGISTGIKVGLGIGIGMCIGVGIGLGLIIHKFRTTTNSLKRITL